jgi:uncharacterized membrane protein
MSGVLERLAVFATDIISTLAVVVVLYGALEAFVRLLRLAALPGAPHGERKAAWRRLGTWLLLGLEFELAADIVATVVSPTWQDIGELAAIALVRTFLNYFLELDLERAEAATVPEAVIPVVPTHVAGGVGR